MFFNLRPRRETSRGGPSRRENQRFAREEAFVIDDEVSHLTRLRSEPSENYRRAMRAGRKMPISTFKMLSGREDNCSRTGRFSLADRAYILGQYLPVNGPRCVDDMDSEAYVSQFSADGSLFVAGFRGSRIKIYDVESGWEVLKDVSARSLRWTITDTSLSPDQRFLVYSSLSPIVHIVNVRGGATDSRANVTEIHEALDFSDPADDESSIGIFSVQFSTDGRELVAGSNNDSIYVYDLVANKLALCFPAHTADINVVTFADETGHVLYSGSDDTLCKVWDRRCFRGEKPAGVLTGHTDGITFIDSRGDGRYFISNCKDQTIKLWDNRKMSSTCKYAMPKKYEWDYRWMSYPPEARYYKHPHDQSLATFRGHSVLSTLVRCYFSPAHSTGQKYIYTGSSDKCVYIYEVVTGKVVAKLLWHESIIRDCSWHPYHPSLVSSSWDGCVARWEASRTDSDR
ncbi:LEC14B homolog [Ananas comosus]|uniref:LEC14B homolog n=1 Tax=Ananas comosus TaxID=4615 RepID=A0A6P5HLA0_ANACO|nr:LEC14B homolog [Ananas comosus]